MGIDATGGRTPRNNSNTFIASAGSVTMNAQPGLTNFVKGIYIRGLGATAGSSVSASLTGLLGGTMSFRLEIPTGPTVEMVPLLVQFDDAIPASGPNVAITLNVPNFGAGNTDVGAMIWGYSQ